MSGIIGTPIISHVREGDRFGSWEMVFSSIMHQPNLNSDRDWVTYLILKNYILVHYSDYTFHLVVLHMKLYLDYGKNILPILCLFVQRVYQGPQ